MSCLHRRRKPSGKFSEMCESCGQEFDIERFVRPMKPAVELCRHRYPTATVTDTSCSGITTVICTGCGVSPSTEYGKVM